MKKLFLEDLKELTEKQIKEHLVEQYGADEKELKKFDILVAYESVGSWGCDSSSWFLLRNKETGQLFENHGSHCSCYGFEGQWGPEPATLEYLKSDKFYFSTGGYDSDEGGNKAAVKQFVEKLK